MTISVNHANVVVGADNPAHENSADEWNAAHTITMATARIIGRTTGGAGSAEELTGDQVLSMPSGWAWDGTNRSLVLTGATVTADHPVFDLTQTWNSAGVTFTGLRLDVTSTASAAASLLLDLKLGGSSKLSVDKAGVINLTGGQIAFPATQVASSGANVLDDYEESTFTPGVSFGGGTTGITYSSRAATYTKIGRVVFFTINITLSSNGSSTGAFKVTALPFTSNNAYFYAAAVSYFNMDLAADDNVTAYVDPNATTISFYAYSAQTDVETEMTEAYTTDSMIIYLSGHYIV